MFDNLHKNELRVVHFSASDRYGAHRAAFLLHKALSSQGVNSKMLVKQKTRNDISVIECSKQTVGDKVTKLISLNKRVSSIYYKYRKIYRLKTSKPVISFNENRSRLDFNKAQRFISKADFILIHWIDNFLSTSDVKKIYSIKGSPIVWTLMDVEPVTGGCHYTNGCLRFTDKCGNCPALMSSKDNDISRKVLLLKKSDLSNLPITFVAPSSWLKKFVQQSSLFNMNETRLIFLSVDTTIFKPGSLGVARKKLNLPLKKKVIFFGARDMREKRKGIDYLFDSLASLEKKINRSTVFEKDDILLVSAGERMPEYVSNFPHRHFGKIDNIKKLALVYQSADVFACPSIEDGGPMMVNEAIMCGTPVVAFDQGVAPNLIDRRSKGYVVELYNIQFFADALYNVLKRKNKQNFLEKRCTPGYQANMYIKLFDSIRN